jgi:O-antigen ligase
MATFEVISPQAPVTPESSPGRTFRTPKSVKAALLVVWAMAILSFFSVSVAGLAIRPWMAVLAVTVPLVLVLPVNVRSVRLIAPYLALCVWELLSLAWTPSFGTGVTIVIQLFLPLLAYLVAWRANAAEVIPVAADIALAGLAIGAAVGALWGLGVIDDTVSPARSTAVGIVALYVVASLKKPTMRRMMLTGGLALVMTLATGSRTAAAVILVLMLFSPAMLLTGSSRRFALASVAVVLVLVGSQTPAFQERFFFSEGGASLRDVVTLSGNLNTAGRRELWPVLIKQCSASPVRGLGAGSGSAVASALSGGVLSHPHNDYLRVYCDGGWIGELLFAGFLIWAFARSLRGAFKGPDRALHMAAAQLVLAYAAIAVTDNPMVYSGQLTIILAVVLALSDRLLVPARHATAAGSSGAPALAP